MYIYQVSFGYHVLKNSLFVLLLIVNVSAQDPCVLGIVYVSEGHTSGDPEDYIELYNSGDTDCSLEGFQLDDNESLSDFTFGEVIISSGGYWTGYEDQEESFSSGLSSGGDIIVFADSEDNYLIVTLEPSQELNSVQLSQSFNENGEGCYTSPTPGAPNGECITLTVDEGINVPKYFSLHQNYPNPFNPTTTLRYDLNKGGLVNVTIYDMLGNVINQLVNEVQNSGYKSIQWNATNSQGDPVSGGVYLYSIEAGEFRQTKKMTLLK